MGTSTNNTSAASNGSILANRYGYVGYTLLGALALGGALWFGIPAFFARYPGRGAIGDDLYAHFPMSRGQCASVAGVFAVTAIGLFFYGRLVHQRLRDEWDVYRTQVNNQAEILRNTFPNVIAVLEYDFVQKLPGIDYARYCEILANRITTALGSHARMKGDFVFLFDRPREFGVEFRVDLFRSQSKSDCSSIELLSTSSSSGTKLKLVLSIAAFADGDPAQYPMHVHPVRTSVSAVEIHAQSTSTHYSYSRSSHGNTSSDGHSTTATPHFLSQDRSNNEAILNCWKSYHQNAYRMLDSAWTISKAEIETYFQSLGNSHLNHNGV